MQIGCSFQKMIVLAGLLLLAVAGCSSNTPPSPDTSRTGTAAEVVIKPIKLAEYDVLLHEHQGKVLVVDFWFKGCPPCERSLPHLVEMQHKHASAGLVVVTIDMDNPREANQAHAIRFLQDRKIALTNLILAEEDTVETWCRKFDLEAFPTTFIYDRQGQRVHRLEGAPPAVIENKVVALLGK